ncbi:hypothetical protein [Micromonospora parastrephiae]|nr:hypothetical protein [Micromonospora parastrephiae]
MVATGWSRRLDADRRAGWKGRHEHIVGSRPKIHLRQGLTTYAGL